MKEETPTGPILDVRSPSIARWLAIVRIDVDKKMGWNEGWNLYADRLSRPFYKEDMHRFYRLYRSVRLAR